MSKKFLYIFIAIYCLMPGIVQAEINLAVVAPMSGDYQALGKELVSGAQIAVDEINNDGGLLGERVKLVVADDPCNDILSVSNAEMIAVNRANQQKINTVIGPFCQNAVNEQAAIYAKSKILQIEPVSVCSYGNEESNKGMIKLVGSCENQSLDFFSYYLQNMPDEKVALVYDGNNRSIIKMASDLQDEFGKAGKFLNIKGYNFSKYQNKYSDLAEEIVDNGLRTAYILANPQQVTKIAKALKKEKKKFKIFVSSYHVAGDFFDKMGKLANGTYFLSLPSLKDSPDFTETLVKLRLSGLELRGLSVYSYSAVKLWKDIVSSGKSFAYDKMTEVISLNSFATAWGKVSYVNGNPEKELNYAIYKYDEGEYTQVY